MKDLAILRGALSGGIAYVAIVFSWLLSGRLEHIR